MLDLGDFTRVDDRLPGDFDPGDLVLGDAHAVLDVLARGDITPGDPCLGDLVLGDFDFGDFVLGDFVFGDRVRGDFVLGDLLRGDFVPGDFVCGDVLLVTVSRLELLARIWLNAWARPSSFRSALASNCGDWW